MGFSDWWFMIEDYDKESLEEKSLAQEKYDDFWKVREELNGGVK